MNTPPAMKTPTIQLTPEIIVSPRLYRFLERSAADLGGDVDYLLHDEYSNHLAALREARHLDMRAAALGMEYEEYIQHKHQQVRERMAMLG